MPTFYPSIPDHLRTWALAQPLFFTASAPRYGAHVNVSPKGLPASTFTIFDPTACAYVDSTGSGCETIAHCYENGRVTVMFCSFGASPRILRFFCWGKVVEWDNPAFATTMKKMDKEGMEGARAIIMLDVWKVQTSCGYGVPILASPSLPSTSNPITQPSSSSSASSPAPPTSTDPPPPPPQSTTPHFEDRKTLGHFAHRIITAGELHSYQAEWNMDSLDGLPGLRAGRRGSGERWLWVGDARAWGRRVGRQREGMVVGLVVGWVVYWVVRLLGGGG